jgi:hypothetical protein
VLRRAALALLAVALLGLLAPSALASHVRCGATITADTTLDSDLTDCPSDAIRIGADNITLDLNGHTVDGELAFGFGNGIENAGFDGVTIENGSVQEFHGRAISLTDAAGNHVRELTVQNAFRDGIDVQGNSANTLIEANRVENAIGIAIIVGASNVRVERNLVSGNGAGASFSDKQGALVVTGSDNRIEGNNVRLRHIEGAGRGVGRGSLVVFGTGNQIVGNTANDSDTEGIVVDSFATGTLLRGNLADRNGQEFGFGNGITVESASTTLSSNSANFNPDLGIRAPAGATDLGGNRAQGNGDPAQCAGVKCDTSPRLFGKRAASTSYSPMSAHAKRASPFTLYFPVTVKKLSAYLDGRGAATGSQVMRAVIYRHSAGAPAQLVARSFQGAVGAGQNPGWVDFYMPFPPRLQPGVYWLGLHSGATGGVARFAWDPVPSSRRFNIDNYDNGPGNPFGSAPVDEKQLSIYASGSY